MLDKTGIWLPVSGGETYREFEGLRVTHGVSQKFQDVLSLPPSPRLTILLFSDSWSNSAQLEMPYVCPNGLVRVPFPPPFLTPKEVRLSSSPSLRQRICATRRSLLPSPPPLTLCFETNELRPLLTSL